MPDNQPVNRRRFFSQSLRQLIAPMADSIESTIERIAQGVEPTKSAATYLRPPGALAERDFLSTCSRCGVCVDYCPAQCIRIDPQGRIAGGAPYIDADDRPCVVCAGLECMTRCPSGALVPTRIAQIDMGRARWNAVSCVRSNGADRACRVCVDECPVGEVAIRVGEDGLSIEVLDPGCIGCGVCQHRCPTEPSSIIVEPRRVMTGS